MASITINDLQENFELDKDALANLLGGSGGGWHCKHWYKVIGYKFTGKKKKRGKRVFHQKKIKYREYKCCFRDYYKYQWVRC
jgi:hypothetical protein